jgi:very-short-patch-repair endonuclease
VWLQQQIDANLLAVSSAKIPGENWTADYVYAGYRKGMTRAYNDTNKLNLISEPSFAQGTEAQFIAMAFNQPQSMKSVQLLYMRAYDSLQGITSDMSLKMGRVLSTGLVQGDHPWKIAQELSDVVGISKTRADMIARTEIIHAHAEGQLDAFQTLGVEQVNANVEVLTAGDSFVCVMGYSSKILTENGLKNIRDIQVGDLVLTHRDRYKKVIKIWCRKTDEEIINISLKGMYNRNERMVSVTSNHPMLVNRKGYSLWVKAGELKQDDSIYYFARKCPVCEKKMPIGTKFCSPQCSIKFGNKKRWEDPEQHIRLSERSKRSNSIIKAKAGFLKKLKDKKYNQMFRDKVSKGQKESYKTHPTHYNNVVKANREKGKRENWGWKNPKKRNVDLQKAHRMIAKNHNGKTWIEKKVEWWLKKINIHYESQKYFNLGGKRRWVDFYLSEYNLIIEVDGDYWHEKLENKEKDIQKDKIAKEYGYSTIRLPGNIVEKNFKEVIIRINKAIHNGCFITVPIKRIKRKKLKTQQPVYNLTVQDDNSYVVNYMVVHNCEECSDLEGQEFSIDEARDLIPQHPNCRCCWSPILGTD